MAFCANTPLFFRHFPCFPKWLYFYAVYDTINENLSVFGGDSHGSGRSLRSCRIPHFPKEGAPCAAARRPPDGRCARAGRRKSMGQVHRKIIGRALAAHLFRKKTPRRRAAGARRGAGRGGRETALSNRFQTITGGAPNMISSKKSSLPALCAA